MTTKISLLTSVFVLNASATLCLAGLYPGLTDEILMTNNIIIVGHLEQGSIFRMTHFPGNSNTIPEGWVHYSSVLVVDEPIKGAVKGDKIRLLILGNELDVSLGSPKEREAFWDHLGVSPARHYPEDYPTNAIEIFYSGTTIPEFVDFPLTQDARSPSVWFPLLFQSEQNATGTPVFFVSRPEQIQPQWLKSYFVALVSKQPEQEIRKLIGSMPRLAVRAQKHLEHVEVQRILELKDPAAKLEALIPYYLKGVSEQEKVRNGIIGCGAIARSRLETILETSSSQTLKDDIYSMLLIISGAN